MSATEKIKHTALVAFGSNMGNGEENVRAAAQAISLLPDTRVIKLSGMFVTEPWGYKDQPDFTNAAAKIETRLSASALLGAFLGIEAAMGRVRGIKNGPRVIDIDLLTYDDEERNTPELVLPHPGMKTRDFVRLPLEDIGEA